MKMIDYFLSNEDRPLIHKPLRYFPIYEKHFARYRHKKIRILEIGVENGGSLLMWRNYFGAGAEIVGIDINPKCKEFESERIKIYIGDQSNVAFMDEFATREDYFDIIIDDGGHHSYQQIYSWKFLYYNVLSPTGIYLVEDCGTSYFQEYGGGFKNPESFIEFSKALVDEINEHGIISNFTKVTASISFYSNIVVFEREINTESRTMAIGIKMI